MKIITDSIPKSNDHILVEITSSISKISIKHPIERRVSFSFGIVYETPVAKIRKAAKIVKEIISEIDKAKFDRAHFNRFDDSALNFDVVYYVEAGDYGKYMDIQQKINLKILERFEEERIEMAYPTRVVYQK